MDNCIFCKMVKGEIPCAKVYEDQDILAFLDINPASKGHTLVITKEHFANFTLVPKDLLGKAYAVAQKIAQAQISQLGAEGANVITNINEIAGQSVMHFHIHVIPRYKKDDGLFQIVLRHLIFQLSLHKLNLDYKKTSLGCLFYIIE